MSVKPHQHAHLANGIRRIKTALMFPSGEIGTFYSNQFRIKRQISGSALIDILNRRNIKTKPWYVAKP